MLYSQFTHTHTHTYTHSYSPTPINWRNTTTHTLLAVSALAALPLHCLTQHLDITRLDLAPLAHGNPSTMADVLAAAVSDLTCTVYYSV